MVGGDCLAEYLISAMRCYLPIERDVGVSDPVSSNHLVEERLSP